MSNPTRNGFAGHRSPFLRNAAGALLLLWPLLGDSAPAQERPRRVAGAQAAKARPCPLKKKQGTPANSTAKKRNKQAKWTSLFNGKTLDGWKSTKFGGEGEVSAKDGQLLIDVGSPLSGVNYTKKTPLINYEVELEAQRVSGSDFFCGLTFPVKKDPCSLILGGWGGGVCGLSSINGMDASENSTTSYMEFKKGRWYRVRLRVMENRIRAWVDGKEIVDQDITDRQLGIRIEVEPSVPFGFATYETSAALRNIRLRKLSEKEIAAARKEPAPEESE